MCKVCWPCNEICERIWDFPCPHGYSPAPIPYYEYASATKQSCISDFRGECESMVTFSDMSEKQEFSERCEAQWPCEASCASISAVCPQRWIEIGDNLCVAPSNYKPSNLTSCPLVNDFSLWSIESKNSVAKLCQYTWSCALQSALQDGAMTLQHAGKLDVRQSVSNWQLDSASGPITRNGEIVGR
jgi:CPW-WPC domain-containing protein